jgi:hypothetical protein
MALCPTDFVYRVTYPKHLWIRLAARTDRPVGAKVPMGFGYFLARPRLDVGDDLTPSALRFASGGRGRIIDHDLFMKLSALGALMALLLRKQLLKLLRGDKFETESHTSESDVRAAIRAYVEGRTTLEELDTWLTLRTWQNADAPPLAHRAELMIAEAARGHRPDLAEDLRALAVTAGTPTERFLA